MTVSREPILQTLYYSPMPTTTRNGKETVANEAIGGIPAIYYFDFKSRGRGQAVRLLWEDAGIAYDNHVLPPTAL